MKPPQILERKIIKLIDWSFDKIDESFDFICGSIAFIALCSWLLTKEVIDESKSIFMPEEDEVYEEEFGGEGL